MYTRTGTPRTCSHRERERHTETFAEKQTHVDRCASAVVTQVKRHNDNDVIGSNILTPAARWPANNKRDDEAQLTTTTTN